MTTTSLTMTTRKRSRCQRPLTLCRWWKGGWVSFPDKHKTHQIHHSKHKIHQLQCQIHHSKHKSSIQKNILNYRWVDGEIFPGQKSSKGYSQPTEMQMTENGCGSSETGKEEADSKTKTTFFYSNPSRVQPSSHPYPSSALPDHHLVCSVSLLSFASYSHRLGNASQGSPR